jgi:hypothetical protein
VLKRFFQAKVTDQRLMVLIVILNLENQLGGVGVRFAAS